MTLSAGTRLGPYEIQSALGAGGMGEVYRARDSKLSRDVALKVLPDSFANDPDRLARFQREAQVLASLNHPNIAAIYGLEEARGIRALVLELVEGPTLADRIARGPLPPDEALPIARQIAEALEAAHERGIIHRDLKPANIKLRPDGTVKVLDFGLAKALDPPASPGYLSQSPTITSPAATRMGVVMGTAAYMSPEQARGKTVDKRADIWAFGCVLYEMLSGKRAFGGEEVTDTIAAVLRAEPDWAALPANTPAKLHNLLQRCLRKDPKRRVHDIADAGIEIDDVISSPNEAAPATPTPVRHSRERLAWALFCVAVVAALGLGGIGYLQRAPADTRIYRSTLSLPANATLSDPGFPSRRFALSPDGGQIAFTAAGQEGRVLLWVRPLDGLVARPLVGTEGAIAPFWSPDSQSLGFFTADGKLKRIEAAGGPPLTLSEFSSQTGNAAPIAAGATWNRDDVIVFATRPGVGTGPGPVRRVPASGGASSIVMTPDREGGETEYWWPFFLPDGQHFLYLALGDAPLRPLGVYVASLDSNERKLVLRGGSNARYVQGHLIFLRETTLMAQAFDVRRLELRGEAVSIAEQVQTGGAIAAAGAFTVSETGVLAYQAGSSAVVSQLVWFDRAGKQIAVLGDQADYGDVALSPDNARVAVSVFDQANANRDIWIYDVKRGLRTRFTFDPADDNASLWSPDNSRIIFNSRRKGQLDMYEKLSSGAGNEEVFLQEGSFDKYPYGWSLDGRLFLYASGNNTPGTGNDLWILPLSGERKPFLFQQTRFTEGWARLSPDGRWIAYISNESGRDQVYVAPFPKPAGKWQISTAGARIPRWRQDGREIFYLAPDNKLMAAEVNGQGPGFEVGAVRPLFQTRARTDQRYMYDVSADGQRFIVNTLVEEQMVAPMTLVVNWMAGLKK